MDGARPMRARGSSGQKVRPHLEDPHAPSEPPVVTRKPAVSVVLPWPEAGALINRAGQALIV